MVFFENGIGFLNFLSESVSELVWCFTDRLLRLPVFVKNYWICVSEFSGIVSRNFSEFCFGFFRKFSACDFSRRMYTSLDKNYLFLYFFARIKLFWDRWCWKAVGINDLVTRTNPLFSIHMLCISNI
jgi:hypothetical protein